MAQDGYNIYNDNVEAIKNANIVVVAVLPQK